MSNRALILTSVLLATTLAACGNGSKGPAETLQEMFNKVCEAGSPQPMLEYTAPQSQAIFASLLAMSEDPKKGAEMKKNIAEECEGKLSKQTVKSEKIEGDTAYVLMDDDEKPTKMIKIDGKWKMVIDKK